MRLGILSPLRIEFGGGFERFCLGFATKMASVGLEVTIMAWDWLAGDQPRIGTEEVEHVLGRAGVTYVSLPTAAVPNRLAPFPVTTTAGRARLRECFERNDVIYFNNAYFLQDLVCASSRRGRRPVIMSAHHSVLWQDRITHDLATRLSAHTVWRRFNAFHTLNDPDATYLRSRGHRRVYTLPIPVDSEAYTPGAGKGDGGSCRVLYLGRLDAQKGVDLLAAALSLISEREREPRLRMTIAGDGPLRPAIARLAATTPWVRHTIPSEPEKLRLLQEADFVVMPSRRESFGIVAAEAMLCGVPLLATRNPGSTESLVDGVTGFEIVGESTVHLADQILKAVNVWETSPERVREMGRNARRIAQERFGAANLWPQYVRMLDEVSVGG